MTLYIMRHGETAWNVLRRFQGRSDIPLNEKGIALAEVTARGLADVPFDLAFTSPLSRARRTAEIVLRGRDVPLTDEPRLIEIAFGAYEGRSALPTAWDPEPDDNLLRFLRDPERYVPPEDGESIPAFRARAEAYLEELCGKDEWADKTILLSTHGGVTTALLDAVDPPEGYFWREGVPYNCSYAVVEVTDGVPELVAENQICYPAPQDLYRQAGR